MRKLQTLAEELASEQGSRLDEFHAVFALARLLRSVTPAPFGYEPAVRAYADRAGRDYDEVWVRLLECWDRVVVAEGEGDWDQACRLALTAPLVFRTNPGRFVGQVASLAYYLSRRRNPFPLPVRKVGEFLGKSDALGSTTVRALIALKFITAVKEANHRAEEAREVLWVGDSLIAPIAEPTGEAALADGAGARPIYGLGRV